MILHSPFYDSAHEAFRDQVRRFVRTEIEPHVDEWDEAGTFPRELYRKAAEVGLLQLNYPEEFGGVPADRFYAIILGQELAHSGSGGVCASLMSHTIGLPAIIKFGSDALKRKVVPPVLAGDLRNKRFMTTRIGQEDTPALILKEGSRYWPNAQEEDALTELSDVVVDCPQGFASWLTELAERLGR